MDLLKYTALLLVSFIFISCSSEAERPWSDAIPQKAPYAIIPAEGATLTSVLQSSYLPFLDDITTSAIPMLSRLDSMASAPLNLNGIMLYPGARDELETIWVTQTPDGFVQKLKQNFYEDFSQNQYTFHEITIHNLDLQERSLFVAQLNDIALFSESSLGIEDAIRAYKDQLPRADLTNKTIAPGHVLMNTPSLEGWVQQLIQVQYHPLIKGILQGTGATLLSVNHQGEQQNRELQFAGNIPISQDESSNMVAAFSGENRPITLDRYISSNAAAFALMRLQPRMAPPTSVPDTSRLDSLLMTDKNQYSLIANTLDQEFSLVMYSESGFLSTGEHLFLRKVNDPATLQQQLSLLADEGIIEPRDDSYIIQSTVLAELIGSSLNNFQDFYLNVTDDVVVISRRKGLAEIVASDYSRRRTIYYEQQFRDIKKNLPAEVSGLFVANPDFQAFIDPYLKQNNYVSALTSRFDVLTIATELNEDNQELAFQLKTFRTQQRDTPYEENWLFPTGSELSGKPVMADMGGSSRDEVIFATKSGNVYALAADGTVVFQTNTGVDEPVGSPVVYDWYGTNQNVILLAAGNKIYGWDDNGQPLPKFPFQMEETITTPVVVSDINRNGIPDALIATADRNLHALDGRGEDLNGWPVTTNAEVNTKPIVANFRGTTSIVAYSENGVHVWNSAGVPRGEFPKFINASLNGSPVVQEDNILGNAADGYLYSIGEERSFADSLNVLENTSDTSNIEAVYVSNSALVGSPSVHNLTVQSDGQTYSESMILTASSNGSIFLVNTSGQLRFNQNMGQPADPEFTPFVTDINQDGQDDIVALANFGRLYVWQANTGERFYSDAIPTNGMSHPVIVDIDNDGFNELIAQTSEGLRCWTIYGN